MEELCNPEVLLNKEPFRGECDRSCYQMEPYYLSDIKVHSQTHAYTNMPGPTVRVR